MVVPIESFDDDSSCLSFSLCWFKKYLAASHRSHLRVLNSFEYIKVKYFILCCIIVIL